MRSSNLHAEIESLLKNLPASETEVLAAVTSLEDDGDDDAAWDVLDRAVNQHPTNALRKAVAERSLKRGDYEFCIHHMMAALRRQPDDGKAQLLLAQAQIALGDDKLARVTLNRARQCGITAEQVAVAREEALASPPAKIEPETESMPNDATVISFVSDETTNPRTPTGEGILDPGRISEIFGSMSAIMDVSVPEPEFGDGLDDVSTGLHDLAAAGDDPAEARTDPRFPAEDNLHQEAWLDAFEAGEEFVREAARGGIASLDPNDISLDQSVRHPAPPDMAQELRRHRTDQKRPAGAGAGRAGEGHPDRPIEVARTHLSARATAEMGAVTNERRRPRRPEPELELDLPDGYDAPNYRVPGVSATMHRLRQMASDLPEPIRRVPWVRVGIWSLVGALAVTGAFVVSASFVQSKRIKHTISAAQSAQKLDLYGGYLAALEGFEAAATDYSVLGMKLDPLVFEKLPGVPGAPVTKLRRRASIEQLAVMGLLEYRFEYADSRGLSARLESLDSDHDHPLVTTATIYSLLAADQPHQAGRLSARARESFPANTSILEARAETLIALGPASGSHGDEVRALVETLGRAPAPSVRHLFLLARLEHHLNQDGAGDRLRAILSDESPEHVGARITLAEVLSASDGGHSQAQATLQAVTTTFADKASPMEIALAHSGMGFLHLKTGLRGRAEEEFKNAVRVAPRRSSLYRPLLNLYVEDSRFDDARRIMAQGAAEDPQGAFFMHGRSELFLLGGMTTQALQMLEHAPPTDPRTHWLRGMVMLDANDFDSAATSFEEAASLDESFVAGTAFALFSRAAGTGDGTKATRELAELLRAHPDEPFVLRANALLGIHQSEQASKSARYQDILSVARDQILQAHAIRPKDSRLVHDLCRIDVLMRNKARAEKSCGDARQVNAEYVPGLLNAARLDMLEGRHAQARDMLLPLRAAHPLNPHVSLALARTQLAVGAIEDATKEINRWLGDPVQETAEWNLLEGHAAFSQRQYTRALGYFKRVHERHPHNGEAAVYLAATQMHLNQSDKADQLLRATLSHPTWGAVAWLRLGELRRRQERFNDATTNLSRALDLFGAQLTDPRLITEAHVELARAWQTRFNWDHANVSRHLDLAATEGVTDDAGLHYTRGLYHLRKRRPDLSAARQSMERAVRVDPRHCESWQSLLGIYQRQNARQAASRARARVKDTCP